MWITRRRHGHCAALRPDASAARYQCGAVVEPRRHMYWLPASLTRRLALRWIAADRGCDATLDVASAG